MRPPARRRIALWLCAIATAGCASALPPLETGSELGSPDPALADPEAAARHLRDAEAAWSRRPDPDAVRGAAELYRRAAVAAPADTDGIVGATRSLVWLAGHLPEPQREQVATEAVATAQWCESRDPGRPDCSYWLALALGVQADARRSTAIDGVRRMAELLRRAIELAPDADHAGPYRVLARVLVNAPGWPTGPGDPDEGVELAQIAVDRAPDYPPNLLALAESLGAVGRPAASREAYGRALEKARRAGEEGHPDAPEWVHDAERALAGTGSHGPGRGPRGPADAS